MVPILVKSLGAKEETVYAYAKQYMYICMSIGPFGYSMNYGLQ